MTTRAAMTAARVAREVLTVTARLRYLAEQADNRDLQQRLMRAAAILDGMDEWVAACRPPRMVGK